MFKTICPESSAKSVILLALMLGLACFISITAQQTSSPARRPLPKPPSGPRGFEKYTGKDATTRLIAAGATREVVSPRMPLAPIEGLAFNSRPFFAWQAAFGSKSYHFVIYDGDLYVNRPTKVFYERDIAATEFRYPAEAPALIPGKLYSWRVSTAAGTSKEDGPPVTFKVLSGTEADEVRQAIEQAKLKTPSTVEDYLDLARVFENYGVWYDALGVASEVAVQNPDNANAQNYYDELLSKLDEKPK